MSTNRDESVKDPTLYVGSNDPNGSVKRKKHKKHHTIEQKMEPTVIPSPPPSIPVPVVKTDRFGFILTEKSISPEERALQEKESRKEEERTRKWLEMFKKWSVYNTQMLSKLQERIQKGIPDIIRSKAWRLIIDPESLTINPNERPTIDSYLSLGRSKCCDTIDVDLDRTMPQVLMFTKKEVRESLKRILYAYSNADAELGYTQGMAFSAAMLLSYMEESEAFWCFHKLMCSPRFSIRGYFLKGFPQLVLINRVWDIIFKEKYKAIANHFVQQGVDHMIYTPSWFLTGFLNLGFPPAFRLHLFDRYIGFGTRSLLSFGLVIISRHKDILIKSPFELLLPIVQKPSESERMNDWRYLIKKWDEHWITEKQYRAYFAKAGVQYFP